MTSIFDYLQGETITVFAGGGNDTVTMDPSAFGFWKGIFFGEAGNDTLTGGDLADYLHGGSGNDTLRGGAGDDTIIGWSGVDVLDGQAGADRVISRDGQLDLLSADVLDIVDRDAFDRRVL